MPIDFNLKVRSTAKISGKDDFGVDFKELARLAGLTDNREIRELLEVIGDTLVKSAKRRIKSTKKDPDGKKWPEYKQSTINFNKRRGVSNNRSNMLYRSKNLHDSISHEVNSQLILNLGSDLPYARAQNFGNPRNKFFGKARAPIPKREFLGISRQDEQKILNIIGKYLAGSLKF